MTEIFIFALAVSIDGFALGLAYVIGGIEIPKSTRFLVSLAAGVLVALAMLLGKLLQNVLTPHLADLFAAAILFVLGSWLFYQAYSKTNNLPKQNKKNKVWQLHIPFLGVIIQILREPASCDTNSDRTIKGREALWLGLALSLDAFGAGFAVALGNYPMFFTSFMAFAASYILLSLAVWLGQRGPSQTIWQKGFLKYLPALLVILLGILKLR